MGSNATGSAETQVNTYTDGNQLYQSVAGLPGGGWVVTWTSIGQDGSFSGVYMQHFSANGTPLGPETQVNVYTTNDQTGSSVAGLPDGGWLVTWSSQGQDGDGGGIYQKRYAADGTPWVLGEVQVNSTSNGNQYSPHVTWLASGGWVVTWTSPDRDGTGIFQQAFDANGLAVGDETRVNTYETGYQDNTSIAPLPDGGWEVTWQSFGTDSVTDNGIKQQRYDSGGDPVGGEILVHSDPTNVALLPTLTVLTGGGWVVTWQEEGDQATDILMQRYDASGVPVGGVVYVNSYNTDVQNEPHVTALNDGGFLVAWESNTQDGSGYGIFQQRYDANGNQVGSETQVNVYTTGSQVLPAVAGLDDGSWVVSWASGQEGNGYGIVQRHFAVDINGTAGADILHGTSWSELMFGLGGNDQLQGSSGNDTLDGGLGDDGLIGGGGVDTATYAGLASGVTVSLAVTAAQDTGAGGVDTLSGIENLVGTNYADTLTGNGGANTLDGGVGADTLTGAAGNDVLDGGAGADTLTGNAGNDILDGAGGADTMNGGADDDTYFVDNTADLVSEGSGLGTDTVHASVAYHLAPNVENLLLEGSGSISGTGNALDNGLTGNGGNNVLNGGTGADTMTGGLGDDAYHVDNVGDLVVEVAGGGTDRVVASVGFTLAANVENLTLTGNASIAGTGNGLGNAITGNNGANTLSGLGGADTLTGGAGADSLDGGGGDDSLTGGLGGDGLTGGFGVDTFVFTAASDTPATRPDTIEDFNHAQHDLIDLSAIDAIAGGTDDAFTLTDAFHHVAGELTVETVAPGHYLVEGDTNGDGIANFAIDVLSATALSGADFML